MNRIAWGLLTGCLLLFGGLSTFGPGAAQGPQCPRPVGGVFLETFDGSPTTPQPWEPLCWGVDANDSGFSTFVSLSCAGLPTVGRTLAARERAVIATGWASPCTTVTVHAANGWDTNFDNLLHE